MKKLLAVALLAASFVGMAEARRCGRVCEPCAPKCEEKVNCIGPARICDVTYSCDKSEDCMPDLCYLVPARRHINKHVHRTEHVSYSCADKPACAVEPTLQQIQELRDQGAIAATCGAAAPAA